MLQNLCSELFKPSVMGNPSQMTHQCSADTLALVLVDYRQSDLGFPDSCTT